jgi:hypothetical protein
MPAIARSRTALPQGAGDRRCEFEPQLRTLS